MGNLDAERDWGYAGDYVEAHVADAPAARRPTTTSSPPARRTPSATCSTSPSPTSASTTGPTWSARTRGSCGPAEVDTLVGDASKASRAARLAADRGLRRARRHDGRPRPGAAPGGRPTMSVALVTGARGQDGSYLVDRLLAEGLEVHGLVRREDLGDDLPNGLGAPRGRPRLGARAPRRARGPGRSGRALPPRRAELGGPLLGRPGARHPGQRPGLARSHGRRPTAAGAARPRGAGAPGLQRRDLR